MNWVRPESRQCWWTEISGRWLPAALPGENQLVDGVWTYAMDQVYQGLRACYADLKRQVQQRFGQTIRQVGAIGVSGMMHGYLPF